MTAGRGRVAVIGAGPAGMATALSVHQAGHDVLLLERYPRARPAGNILNLWPPPVKALGLLGVDITDLGAPCHTEFRSISGHTRVRVELPDDVIRRYAGGFIGLLRPARSSRRSSWASSSTMPRRQCRPSATRSWITRRCCRRSWASPRPVRSSSS